MTKFRYGGFWLKDPEVFPDDDWVKLMTEIAACAVRGRRLRPNLARWFVDTWRANRIVVLPPLQGGRPRTAPLRTQTATLEAFDRLRASGVAVSEALRRARRETKTKAKEATIRDWLQERRDLLRQLEQESNIWHQEMISKAMAETKAAALARFAELASEGVDANTALELLDAEPSLAGMKPTLDTLREWQQDSAYAQTGKRKTR